MIGSTHPQNTQRGYILLPVVLAIALLASIAWLINREGAIHADMVTNTTEAVMAEQVARAGLAHATWAMQGSGCAGDMAMSTAVPFGQAGTDNYTATVTTPGGGTSASILSVDQDAWFRSDQPDVNNGAKVDMHLRKGAGVGTEVAMYRFDLSSLAAGAQINSAVAWFYVTFEAGKDGGPYPEGPLTVHAVTEDWVETGPTWNNMSTAYGDDIIAVMPAESDAFVWVKVNLTAQVQAWVNGAEPNYGIMIWPTADGTHAKLVSKEGASSQRPRLEVVIGTGPPSPATLTATGTLENSNTRTLMRTDVPVYQPDSYTIMQPGDVSGEDAEIWEQAPGNNYGNATEAWVSSATTDTTRTLLRFNMGAVPAGARILEATLSLHRAPGATGGDEPVSAHRIRNPWSEDSVTWNQRETGTNWDTAGADFDSMAVATTLVGLGTQRSEWSITPLAQGWVDGSYPNYGVALVSAIAGMAGKVFHTSDHGTPNKRPSLTITYACECGSPCVVSQGSGNVLLVVNNDTSPTVSETYRRDLFESWGYKVNLIGQVKTPAEFAAAATANDVLYISSTVDPGTIGTKLSSLPIGIVNEQGEMNDDLGIGNNADVTVGTAIDVTDTSHYITGVFPAGPMEIYSAGMGQQIVTGGHAPGLQTLAESGGDTSLAVLETDAILVGGGAAAGRRVILPLGADASFNWDYLNSNGRLMVQRALQWGADSTGSQPLIYRDEFNSFTCDTADDYSGSDAPRDWSPWSWSEVGETSNSCGNNVKLGTDLGNTRLHINTSGRGIERQADLSLFTTAWLHFDYRRANFGATTDALTVSVSANGGTSWTEVGRFIGPVNDTVYQGASIDISAYTGTDTMIRFMEETASGGRSLYIDNVQIDEVAPTGLQTILFVVPDATALGPQDAVKKTLMESWGYTVAPITASDPPVDYAAAVAAADVVYISEEITSTDLGTKLRNAAIGIVNEETALVDEFGIADNRTSDNETDTNIVDATHYITWVFGSGVITLASIDTDLNQLTGTLAPGLHSLSETSGVESLVTISTGGLLNDGGTAAGRRVQLPWGGDGFDINLLTADGQTLMRRAIEWAGGVGGDSGGGGSSCSGSIFRDEFNLESYSENNGTVNWGGDWVEGGEGTDPGGGEIRIEEDIDEFQLRIKKNSRSITRPLDLTGFTNATLNFDSRRAELKDTDSILAIEVTSDGSTWFEIGLLAGPDTDSSYVPNSIDITDYISNLSAIRFATGPDNDKNDLFYLDNIEVCAD